MAELEHDPELESLSHAAESLRLKLELAAVEAQRAALRAAGYGENDLVTDEMRAKLKTIGVQAVRRAVRRPDSEFRRIQRTVRQAALRAGRQHGGRVRRPTRPLVSVVRRPRVRSHRRRVTRLGGCRAAPSASDGSSGSGDPPPQRHLASVRLGVRQ